MLYIPTRTDIESLQEGDSAPDCFGKLSKVVEVGHRGSDTKGKSFVMYFTAFGSDGSTCSMSMKEDELVRHVGTSAKFTSHQLDDIEAEMLAKGERTREL